MDRREEENREMKKYLRRMQKTIEREKTVRKNTN